MTVSGESRNSVHDDSYLVGQSCLDRDPYVNMKCKQSQLHKSGAALETRDHLPPITARLLDLTPNLLKDRFSLPRSVCHIPR